MSPALIASQRLTWLRLNRDWAADPRLWAAADLCGVAAAAGYVALLGQACKSDGIFIDLPEVIGAIRSDGIGLHRDDAHKVAEVLISVGLITATDLGYEVTDWGALFRPPHSAITKMARGDGRGDERGDEREGRGGVAEQEQEPEQDQSKSKSSPRLPLSVNTILKTMDFEPLETMILPPKAEMTATHCSHGEAFATIPAGVSRNGRPFESFVAARHKLKDGTNCHERPTVAK